MKFKIINEDYINEGFPFYSLNKELGSKVTDFEYNELRKIFSMSTKDCDDYSLSEDFTYTGKMMLDFAHNGRFDYRGTRLNIENPVEVAQAVSIFRESFETFRFLFLRSDTVVATLNVTSKLSFTSAINKYYNASDKDNLTRTRTIDDLKLKMEKYGADGYIILHNHPASSSSPSRDDIMTTKVFMTNIDGFIAHIIVGNQDISIINKDLQVKSIDIEGLNKNIEVPNDFLGKKFIDGKAIENFISSKLKPSSTKSQLVYTTSNGELIAIQEVDNYEFNHKGTLNYIKNQMTILGVSTVFLATQSEEVFEFGKNGVNKGILYDVLLIETNNVSRYHIGMARDRGYRGYKVNKHYNA